MQAEGISLENNFFIQGFMGMAWFMFPASMVVGTVSFKSDRKSKQGHFENACPADQYSKTLYSQICCLAIAGGSTNLNDDGCVLYQRRHQFG